LCGQIIAIAPFLIILTHFEFQFLP
jgi:hypothetical protein